MLDIVFCKVRWRVTDNYCQHVVVVVGASFEDPSCDGKPFNKRTVCLFDTCEGLTFYVAPTFVTSTTFVTAHQFCEFISTAFINLTTFINFCQLRPHQFCQQYQPLMSYRRGHYFCQQGSTTFVNRNFIAYLRVLCSVTILSNQLVLVIY